MNSQPTNVHQPVALPPWRTILQVLRYILRVQENILATQQELANALNDVNTKFTAIGSEVDKVAAETQSLLQKVTDLQNTINQGGNTSPAVDAALAAVQASAQSVADKLTAVDNLVPDVPVGPDTSATQGQPNQSATSSSTP